MKQQTILLKLADYPVDIWLEPLQHLMPHHRVLPWDADVPPQDVDFVIGWMPDAHWVNSFPNLKALMSVGSGVDHIKHLTDLRPDIPVYRNVSPNLAQRMKEFVVAMLMAWHRRYEDIRAAQAKADWQQFMAPLASEVTVGIMGYGQMGQAASAALAFLGYDVRVWARSPKALDDVQYFHGTDGFEAFNQGLDALICLIPLTPETENIINGQSLGRLNDGALLLNCARGGHVVNDDVLTALDSGKLGFAVLDVFRQEPLDGDHPFWAHEKVLVTGHTSGYVSPTEGPALLAEMIHSFVDGTITVPLYDSQKGY